ncbi:MAG: glycine cleavage system protein H [Anaerolineae bacterium]|nr:glycine cleavage system protein H [Anaerolineae bacterium]
MEGLLELKIDKFTFKVAPDRFYNSQGVWAMLMGKVVRIGLSDFLQQRSGDVAFSDVKPEGTVVEAGQDVATIETIKINIDLSSPLSGKIIQVNPAMETGPEVINQDPYGEGWLCEIEAGDWQADSKNLLSPSAYFIRMKQEAEDEAK